MVGTQEPRGDFEGDQDEYVPFCQPLLNCGASVDLLARGGLFLKCE